MQHTRNVLYKSLKAFLRLVRYMLAAEQFNMYVILRLPATAAACILLPAPLALLTIISKRGYIPATTIKIAGRGENYYIPGKRRRRAL
jgi:hypothetical protein